ncbi:MAG: ISAzo13 family transposase, partial [Cyanobacteria bacterium J06573_11]
MLSEPVKATFKDAARKLTGAKKRAFTAQVALDYFDGSARKTERSLGWDRVMVQRGLDSLETGIPYADNYSARGRKKTEYLVLNLTTALR